jgi:hypothetical protein
MLEIYSSEIIVPASTQSGVGIGEANSDVMLRERRVFEDNFVRLAVRHSMIRPSSSSVPCGKG